MEERLIDTKKFICCVIVISKKCNFALKLHTTKRNRQLNKVSTLDDLLLSLWAAYNVVHRLAGDPTEDTAFPKVLLPLPAKCPTCRNGDGTFSRDNSYVFKAILPDILH